MVLHVDHIKPVAGGGESEIVNYVTSCADCNLGKGKIPLDDKSTIEKQRRQIEELNERREQLEMMLDWRNGLADIKDQEIKTFLQSVLDCLAIKVNPPGLPQVKRIIREYGLSMALDAVDIAAEKDDFEGSILSYIEGICRTKKKIAGKPYMDKLLYIRGILRNRLSDYKYASREILDTLEDFYLSGIPVDVLSNHARQARRWETFVDDIRGVG